MLILVFVDANVLHFTPFFVLSLVLACAYIASEDQVQEQQYINLHISNSSLEQLRKIYSLLYPPVSQIAFPCQSKRIWGQVNCSRQNVIKSILDNFEIENVPYPRNSLKECFRHIRTPHSRAFFTFSMFALIKVQTSKQHV